MNNCTFIGRFTADPALRRIEKDDGDDTCVARFTLAVQRRFKGKSKVNFLDFEIWDSAAEVIVQYCHKGDVLIVNDSSARNNIYEDKKTGQTISKIVFRIEKFDFPSNIGLALVRKKKEDDDEEQKET